MFHLLVDCNVMQSTDFILALCSSHNMKAAARLNSFRCFTNIFVAIKFPLIAERANDSSHTWGALNSTEWQLIHIVMYAHFHCISIKCAYSLALADVAVAVSLSTIDRRGPCGLAIRARIGSPKCFTLRESNWCTNPFFVSKKKKKKTTEALATTTTTTLWSKWPWVVTR